MNESIVAIIPARGGSKGIPGKNIVPIAGKPLVAWSIEQAKMCKRVDAVYVTTDDDDIACVARAYGAEVIRRPPELSTDLATSESALVHALDVIKGIRGEDPDTVVFLQATSPVRETVDIENALNLFESRGADSLFSAARLEDHFIWEDQDGAYVSVNYDFKNRKRRQDVRPRFLENGSIYVFRVSILRICNNRLGGQIEIYEMPLWKSHQIDEQDDILLCEFYLKTKLQGWTDKT